MLHSGYFEATVGPKTVGRCSSLTSALESLHVDLEGKPAARVASPHSICLSLEWRALCWPASFYRIRLSTLLQPRGLYLNRLEQFFGPQPQSGLLNQTHHTLKDRTPQFIRPPKTIVARRCGFVESEA